MDKKPRSSSTPSRSKNDAAHNNEASSHQRPEVQRGGGINYSERRRRAKPAISSRLVVLDLMTEIIGKGYPLQEVVKRHEDWGKLEDRDRRFAHRLISIILRYRRTARIILNRYLQKPINRKDRKAEAVLILAVVELVWADGDGYAVVDQAVRLMRGRGFTHMTGLANAVLRKVANDQSTLSSEVFDPLDNAPDWLRNHLVQDWPDHAADMMTSFLTGPSLDFSCIEHPEKWATRLKGTLLAHGSIRRRGGMVTTLDGYDEGGWWVQDAAATLPALLLQSAFNSSPDTITGKNVVDLCAAPGGKTAQLVAMGANVTALDSSAERLKTLTANMKRLKMSPEVVTADGTTWSPSEKMDAVLLDAPCSATGTLRRRPDILSHEQAPDLQTLNNAQCRLLASSAEWLKPGGILVYATCSVLKSEGEDIVDNLPSGLTILPIKADEIDGISLKINDKGHARVMPDVIGTSAIKIMPEDIDSTDDIPQGNDGFFIARFVKS